MPDTGAEVLAALLNAGVITADDLHTALTAMPTGRVPTHAEFSPVVEATCSPGSARTYRTTFRRLVAAFGPQPLDTVDAAALRGLAMRVRAEAARQGGTGVGAEEGFIRAARRFYATAEASGHIRSNPALRVPYTRRNPRVRRALNAEELESLYAAVVQTSNDLALDTLLLDFHRSTACRQGGATNLRLADLNLDRGSVLLREKGGTEREVPCPRDVIARIRDLNAARCGVAAPAAFRYQDGTPLTRRRYNTLFGKVRQVLPWAERLGVSAHWLRHTTLTDISLATSGRIASAYAGHVPHSTTDGYTQPTFADLLAAHDLVFPDYAICAETSATPAGPARPASQPSPPTAQGPPAREASSGTSRDEDASTL